MANFKKEKYAYHSYKQQGIISIGFVLIFSVLNKKNKKKLIKCFATWLVIV